MLFKISCTQVFVLLYSCQHQCLSSLWLDFTEIYCMVYLLSPIPILHISLYISYNLRSPSSTPGRKRLQSRNHFSEHTKQLTSHAHGKTSRVWAEGTWETRWDITRCRLRTFIHTQSNKPIGHDLARHSLVSYRTPQSNTRRRRSYNFATVCKM